MNFKKSLLFTLSSIALMSCHEAQIGRPVTYCIPEGNVIFNIMDDANKMIGTMQFLPLKEKEISIHFVFDSSFGGTFVFTYRSNLFEIARQQNEDESVSATEALFGHYPYVETKYSLHSKLSRIVFDGTTKSVTEGKALEQKIALNGSGNLIFEYDTANFDTSNSFYGCDGLSFMPSGYYLAGDNGKKTDEGADVWYYISDGDIFHYRTKSETSGL